MGESEVPNLAFLFVMFAFALPVFFVSLRNCSTVKVVSKY